ncbi:tetratricopeptide repeat protein [Shewanella saliphila]|uniref:MSHA biogenesis protein MshN n=1 Tax=Shewanella saliphila TaxID=2282698 RepID=A0ABQ2Q1L5_9GAMM|nr:tetratricopeptide repeat protein [Shewanella saliphila]MCL1100668.1 tetratricopeptide repeat protein [Shewanella saliphila]GGP41571.1 MSHA biogenesis protein MshN [Shewanella saliphila]
MSVIIKMLRDLEQRQQPGAEQPELETSAPENAPSQPKGEFVRPQVQYYPTEKSRLPLLVTVVCVLLFIPAVWYGVSMYQQTAPTAESPLMANNADEPLTITDDTATQITRDVEPQSTDVEPSNNTTLLAKQQSSVSDNAEPDNASPRAEGTSADTPSTAALAPATASIQAQEPIEQTTSTDDAKLILAATSQPTTEDVIQVAKVVETLIVAKDTPTVQPVVSPVNAPQSSPKIAQTSSSSNAMTVKEVVISKAEMAQLQYRKATDAENAQRLEEAASFYLEAIILQPSLHKARKQLVAIYYGQNNTTTAMRLLESGISMFPQEWEFYVILSRLQTETKSFDSAQTTLAMIPDNSSWARDKWVAQTELAQNTQDFVLAEQAYRQLLQAESTQARWWMGLGYALDSQQKYIPAAQAYRSALSYEGLSTSAMDFIENRLAQLGETR